MRCNWCDPDVWKYIIGFSHCDNSISWYDMVLIFKKERLPIHEDADCSSYCICTGSCLCAKADRDQGVRVVRSHKTYWGRRTWVSLIFLIRNLHCEEIYQKSSVRKSFRCGSFFIDPNEPPPEEGGRPAKVPFPLFLLIWFCNYQIIIFDIRNPRQKHIDIPYDPSPFWSSMRPGTLRTSALVETTIDIRASATPLWVLASSDCMKLL